MHGGGAPQVQRSAKARLLEGADLAIDYLLNLLTPKPPCEHCGRSDADRDPVVVRACQLVLDRSGFHPTLTVEQVPVQAPNPYDDFTAAELADRAEAIAIECRRIADEEASHLLPEVTEGFLVPEEGTTLDVGQTASPGNTELLDPEYVTAPSPVREHALHDGDLRFHDGIPTDEERTGAGEEEPQ